MLLLILQLMRIGGWGKWWLFGDAWRWQFHFLTYDLLWILKVIPSKGKWFRSVFFFYVGVQPSISQVKYKVKHRGWVGGWKNPYQRVGVQVKGEGQIFARSYIFWTGSLSIEHSGKRQHHCRYFQLGCWSTSGRTLRWVLKQLLIFAKKNKYRNCYCHSYWLHMVKLSWGIFYDKI